MGSSRARGSCLQHRCHSRRVKSRPGLSLQVSALRPRRHQHLRSTQARPRLPVWVPEAATTLRGGNQRTTALAVTSVVSPPSLAHATNASAALTSTRAALASRRIRLVHCVYQGQRKVAVSMMSWCVCASQGGWLLELKLCKTRAIGLILVLAAPVVA